MGMPIVWQGSDCFTHMLAVGPTRCGKTATILKPMIYQLLLQKKRGVPLGISVVEPKGDVAEMVNEMCLEMGIPCIHVDPNKTDSASFNPMEGEMDTVAEATVVVLKGLFGKQDAFFATVQELSARNVTKLLKELHGDDMDIIDVMNTLRDQHVLQQKVAELKHRDGMTDLVHFFESELLGSMREKYHQFVIGLRAQLENIVSNEALRTIMTGRSDVNIDEHLETGGVLAVNTALGKLRKAGDAFGQFMIMHLQNGTFRRPGTEDTRIPHFLIVDEYSRYINPDVEIFLSLAAEYRVAGIFATQSLGQLEIESGNLGPKAMKQAILTSCRNKICFGGISAQDAKEFAEEFGKDKVIMRQSTYKNRVLLPRLFPDSYRDTEDEEYRFDPTDLMDGIPRFNFVHKLLQDGTPQKPALAKGQFVPRNWKELREWENQKSFKKINLNSLSNIFQRRKKIKKGQASESELVKQVGAESEVERIIQPKLDTQHSYEVTPDKKLSRTPLPEEKRQDTKIENVDLTEEVSNKNSVQISTVETIIPPKIKEKEASNVVRSNDGFWD
ncbi:type IV secretory system conjugative DNA transfer family protein [Saccharococcus sp. Marseille-Q5394]|uniref:type IV secretory system conjugative DNA transfer family protein n=1 Tax=Saccharococcus sp. Marseille-Q5394 TaxID=2972778 RepID=UPI0021C822B7|nr:type IV secretory system conjugative DNA transfer family protein [Saccharococcus sp. Marseille-Q5394]